MYDKSEGSRLLEGSDLYRGTIYLLFPQNLGWVSQSVQPQYDLRKGIVDNYDKIQLIKLKVITNEEVKVNLIEHLKEKMVASNRSFPGNGNFL